MLRCRPQREIKRESGKLRTPDSDGRVARAVLAYSGTDGVLTR